MSAPVPLIQLDPTTNNLMLCQEGIDCLTSTSTGSDGQRTSLLIVACAGLYRTGKSFLLNRIVNSLSTTPTTTTHFSVGKTTEACTRGIWIWDPQITIRGSKLILLDSEGLASLDQDENHDAQIFCLALLLSSFFMLNTQGVIDENAIDRLYLVGEITKRICSSSSSSSSTAASTAASTASSSSTTNEQQLSEYFPPFMWLLRDFHLDLEHQGRTLSTNEYLENSLADRGVNGGGRRTEERNDTRRAIRQLFKHRQCFTMVRPALEEESLRHASDLTDNELRPTFLIQLNKLVHIIKTQTPKKQIMGTDVDGVQLIQLAQEYITAINNGAVPEIKGAWENVVETTYQVAKKNCLISYTHAMHTQCTVQSIIHHLNEKDGYEGYVERPTGSFYACIDQMHDACVHQALQLYTKETRGCATCTGKLHRNTRSGADTQVGDAHARDSHAGAGQRIQG